MADVAVRIYLPLDAPTLRRVGATGELGPAPLTAYAVTTDLRREHPGVDEEELEYLAFTDAARSAGGLAPLVVAADVDADVVTDLLEPGARVSAVRVAAGVPRRRLASLHLAEPGLAVADDDGLPAYSWYDATELDDVAAALDRG